MYEEYEDLFWNMDFLLEAGFESKDLDRSVTLMERVVNDAMKNREFWRRGGKKRDEAGGPPVLVVPDEGNGSVGA